MEIRVQRQPHAGSNSSGNPEQTHAHTHHRVEVHISMQTVQTLPLLPLHAACWWHERLMKSLPVQTVSLWQLCDARQVLVFRHCVSNGSLLSAARCQPEQTHLLIHAQHASAGSVLNATHP